MNVLAMCLHACRDFGTSPNAKIAAFDAVRMYDLGGVVRGTNLSRCGGFGVSTL